MSNFKKAALFNECMGKTPNSENWEVAENQAELIHEEVQELFASLVTQDRDELRDAIADVLVTVYGLAYMVGIDADKDYDTVHRSNMTKFTHTYETAIQTMKEYAARNVETQMFKSKHGLYAVLSAEDQVDDRGLKFIPKNKLLKPASYEAPIWN